MSVQKQTDQIQATSSTTPLAPMLPPMRENLQDNRVKSANITHVEQLVTASRTLVGCENSFVLGRLVHVLEGEARRRGELFVAIHNPSCVARLHYDLCELDGTWQTKPGRLARVLLEGGWLLINYDNFTSAEAESLNELFGHRPTFLNMQVNPKLRLVGAIGLDMLHGGDVSQAFVSRFGRFEEVRGLVAEPDPAAVVPTVPPGEYDEDAAVIDLFGTPGAFNSLWDRPLLADGRAKVETGLMRAHLARHNKVILRNAPMNDPVFAEEFREFMRGERVDLMGPVKLGPGQSIRLSAGYTDAEIAASSERAQLKRTSRSTNAYVIHERNFANLFAEAALRNGRLESTCGALETLPPDVALRVVAELTPAQWLQLMHTPHRRQIMVDPDVAVPHWMDLPLAREVSPRFQILTNATDFQQIKPGIATQVSTDDITATSAILSRVFPDALVLDVTPDMSVDDLLFTLRKNASGYMWEHKAMWRALFHGETVILRRLSCNRNLATDLAGLCTGQPASLRLMDAEVGLFGRLILLEDTPARLHAGAYWRDCAQAERLEGCQKRLHQVHPFVDVAWVERARTFLEAVTADKVMAQKLAGGSPATSVMIGQMAQQEANLRRNGAPNATATAMQRSAMCATVSGSLQDDPEMLAYAEVCARVAFAETTGQRAAIDADGFSRVYGPGHLWRATRYLNDAALGDLRARAGALGCNSASWHGWLKQVHSRIEATKKDPGHALHIAWGGHEFIWAREDFPRPAPGTPATWQASWAHRVALCRDALTQGSACSLQGPPGSGKTYMTQVIARELGARVFGPLSLGAQTRRENLLGAAYRRGDHIVFGDGPIATWARDSAPGIKLLVVDEANLTESEFWNFLRALFDADPAVLIDGERVRLSREHKVIFTGNADTMPGRHTHALVKNHFTHIYFEPFCEAFLDHITESCLHRVLDKLPAADVAVLRTSLGGALNHLRSLAPELTISPRNVEEAAMRCGALLAAHPNLPLRTAAGQAARDAWAGLLSAQTQDAWRGWLALMLGCPRDSRSAASWVTSLETGHDPMALTSSTRVCAQAIANFIEMRDWRRAAELPPLGQIGLLISGPSGRGKDELVMRLCGAAGFEVIGLGGERDKTSVSVAAGRRLFYVNAGIEFDHLRRTIEQARELGALVLISELNLLPSALLEGELNACLTGSATPGFAVFATINPDDFVGREQLSEAIGNRFVHHRLAPYTALELLAIVQQHLVGQPDGHAEAMVAFHQACIGRARDAHLAIMPTARELLRACAALPPDCTAGALDAILRATYAVYLATAPATAPAAPLVLEDPCLAAYRCLAGWLCAPTRMQVVRDTEQDAQKHTNADLRLVSLPPWGESPLDDHSDLGYLGWATIRVSLGATAQAPALADVIEAATHRLARRIFAAFGTPDIPLEDVFPDPVNTDVCIAALRAADSQRDAFAEALRMELLYPGRLDELAELLPKAARLTLQSATACAHEVARSCDGAPEAPVAHLAAATVGVSTALSGAQAAWEQIPESISWVHALVDIPWERIIPRMKRPRMPDIPAPKLPPLPKVSWPKAPPPWLKKVGKGLGVGAAVTVGVPLALCAGALGLAASPAILAGWAAAAATGHGLETGRRALHKAGPYRPERAIENLRHDDVAHIADWKRRFVDGSLARIPSSYGAKSPDYAHFLPHRTIQTSQFFEKQHGWYLIDGYLSHFDAHGDLTSTCSKQAHVPLVTRKIESDPSGPRLLKLQVDVTSERRPMFGKDAVVRLATLPNTRPALKGTRLCELSDGTFAALMSTKGSVISPETYSLCYELIPAPAAAPPIVVPRLDWPIHYGLWPELRAFLQTLPRQPESAGALCVWLRENVIFDRGREVYRRYLATGQKAMVNRLLQVRRGSGYEVAAAFVAIARDYLGLHVRAAVGRYGSMVAKMQYISYLPPVTAFYSPVIASQPPSPGNYPMCSAVPPGPHEPKSESNRLASSSTYVRADESEWAGPKFTDFHIWAEVHFPGRGWVTFDPTPRRLSTAWRKRVALKDEGPLLSRFIDVEEEPFVAHRRAPKQPLMAPRRNPASQAEQAALVAHLVEKLGPKLYESTLQPASKYTASPPGLLDVVRLAAGDLKPFVACDVGRKPRARKLILASMDISAQVPGINARPDLGSRPVWDAVFSLGAHIDVMCKDGGMIEVTDTNALFACAETCDKLRARAVRAQVDLQRSSKRMYASITLQDIKTMLKLMSRAACGIVDRENGRLFKNERGVRNGSFSRPSSTPVKLTPRTVSHHSPAALAGFDDVRFKHMSCAEITKTLSRMPNMKYLEVQKTGRFAHTLTLPFLPQLRSIETYDAPSIKTIDMQFVPGDAYVPLFRSSLELVVHTDQKYLLGREALAGVTYKYVEQPVKTDMSS